MEKENRKECHLGPRQPTHFWENNMGIFIERSKNPKVKENA